MKAGLYPCQMGECDSMPLVSRLVRHLRLSYRARNQERPPTPPFLILFINSVCNMRCDHCFYWDSLNRKTDLTFEELSALSRSLGPLENLNLSGGEPFLRPEFAEICAEFIRNNRTRQIFCPTNGYFTEKTETQLRQVLRLADLDLFTAELSLDGMTGFHDRFRGKPGSFARILETYDMLVTLQSRDPRLQIHAITTATADNIGEIVQLSEFLYERCPQMSRHNIALLRGERKRATILGPPAFEYAEAARKVSHMWAARKDRAAAHLIDPILHWAKAETRRMNAQVVPCRAGILTAVVYANGDVSLCEQQPPLGNLRHQSFLQIWHSPEAIQLRRRIWDNQCCCTNEIFLWSSLAFQPVPLLKAVRATGTLSRALRTLAE